MDEESMNIDDSVMVRTEQEGQIAQLRQNLETQKEKNNILQNKIRKQKKEQEQSKALNKTLRKECDHFKFLSKANSQKIEDLQRVNKYLQNRNKFLEEQLQEQKTTIESLNHENGDIFPDDLSKIENIESQKDTKISSLTEQNEFLQNIVSELRQQVQKYRQTALNSSKKIHDLEYLMEQKKFELNQLKQNIETINPEEEKVCFEKKLPSQVVAMEMIDILNILKQFLNSLEKKKMIKAKNIIQMFVQQQVEVWY